MGSSVSEADESGRSFEVVDVDGNALRFVAADFDEMFETDDEAEMRRHLELGWVVLDEGRERGTAPRGEWLDALLRRGAGRVLPAAADPSAGPAADVTVYLLGHLKQGTGGQPLP